MVIPTITKRTHQIEFNPETLCEYAQKRWKGAAY